MHFKLAKMVVAWLSGSA